MRQQLLTSACCQPTDTQSLTFRGARSSCPFDRNCSRNKETTESKMWSVTTTHAVALIILLLSQESLSQADGGTEDRPPGPSLGVEEGLLVMCIILTILLILSGLYVLISSARSRSKRQASLEGLGGGGSRLGFTSPLASNAKKRFQESEVLFNLPSVGATENSVSDSSVTPISRPSSTNK